MWDKLNRQKFMHLAAGAVLILLIIQIILNSIAIYYLSNMLGVDAFERINIKMLDIVKDTVMIVLLYFFGRNQKNDTENKD
ncbi:hypothetical protein ESA94_20510 [Lacibacter luteus]|uniref:Uncharacterized protein n=1 Tax=Lacibacter luteus TaxID=2508719 RepID=A0A4Q1CDC9_9BACT|nr:hypothetical protein [Lacibacter luteus]RXK57584.1 hypothetical protein ESA94_20510 [Lacibacter luteus]